MSVIVVTRNRRDELRHCLAELGRQDLRFELVVVDNGSSDGSLELVRSGWPEAVIVAAGRNLGACEGRNRGARAARGELLVFLDDDASFADPRALSRIRGRFEGNLELGIVAARSYLASTGDVERDALLHRDKRMPREDCAVTHFCAVGFGMRRELFERIGGFPDDFFYYCEEIDVGWRVIDAGYIIVWASDLIVLHRRSELERPRGRWVQANMRNRVRVAIKHLPLPFVLTYALAWWPWLAFQALRHRALRDFAIGVREFVSLLPATLRQRRPLRAETVRRIRQLDGRLLF